MDSIETIDFEKEQEQSLFDHYRFVASKNQEPLRVDKFILNFLENITRNKIQNAVKNENILVNDSPVKSNYKVKPNDVVRVVMDFPPKDITIMAEEIPLDIVFEDEHLIVVNKDAMMVVHPAYGNYSGTLVNALIYHFKNLPFSKNNQPGLVHRIDKGTSGLLVIAKTEYSMSHLAQQFFNKTVKREYYALVWGNVKEDSGTLESYISRNPNNRFQMMIFDEPEKGKFVKTHYKVIRRYSYVTLIKCRLKTGRTHQIRAHMKYIGHTLFNDARYKGDQILKGIVSTKYKQFVQNCFSILPRQALHAKTLGFIHPHTKEELFFDSDLPDDFQAVLNKWEKYIPRKEDMPNISL